MFTSEHWKRLRATGLSLVCSGAAVAAARAPTPLGELAAPVCSRVCVEGVVQRNPAKVPHLEPGRDPALPERRARAARA